MAPKKAPIIKCSPSASAILENTRIKTITNAKSDSFPSIVEKFIDFRINDPDFDLTSLNNGKQ